MSEIHYKRLFEVRILHGYHLDNWFADASGKKGMFQEFGADSSVRTDNQNFVLENKYNILNDLSIEPTAGTQQLLRDLKMRWRATPTGFMVDVEARKEGIGNDARFFPQRVFPANARWKFMLRSQNAFFSSFTNQVLRPSLPARHYFTNLIPPGEGKTYPSLSMHLPLFSSLPNRTWEMGELTRTGDEVRVAKKDTDNGKEFIKLFGFNSDWHHFAHSFDRKVLPKSFSYRFDPVSIKQKKVIKNVEFALNYLNGVLIKRISREFTKSKPAPAEFSVDFNFKPVPENATDAEKLKPDPIQDGWYDLTVKINQSIFESRRVLLRSDLGPGQSVFGLVDISTEATDPQYSLFNADDHSLNIQLNSDASPPRLEGRIFEIRLLGRLAYWQYLLPKPLAPVPTDPDFEYDQTVPSLKTSKPRRFVSVRAPLTVNIPGADIFLPTPEPSALKYNFESKQYYAETILSTL